MSESALYFLLSQLSACATASLRFSLAFVVISGVSWLLVSKPTESSSIKVFDTLVWAFAARYNQGWGVFLAMASGVFFWLSQQFMPHPNPFILRGGQLALILVTTGLVALLLEQYVIRHLQLHWQRYYGLLKLVVLWFVCHGPSFSRSDRIWLSVTMVLFVAWTVGYFALSWQAETPVLQTYRACFNAGWLLLFLPALGIYLLWLQPILAGLPPEGEFYPFVALCHWFLVINMILYLGNLYIQYWLKQQAGLFIWRYSCAVAAIVFLWLTTHIFDTLAL